MNFTKHTYIFQHVLTYLQIKHDNTTKFTCTCNSTEIKQRQPTNDMNLKCKILNTDQSVQCGQLKNIINHIDKLQ